jgi:membrane-associated protease RseP (regulator of RpoE activity)
MHDANRSGQPALGRREMRRSAKFPLRFETFVLCGSLTFSTFVAPRAQESPAPATPPAFEAGDISIGEPIALPFSPPAAVAAPAAAPVPAVPPAAADVPPGSPAAGQRSAAEPAAPLAPPATAAAAPAPGPKPATPGNGWLGLVVAESAVPGRWMVAEIAPGGPAATAGVLAGDEVRAIDGLPLRSSDEVAQALTTIATGQEVRLAIARGEQVGDVTLLAVNRPAPSRPSTTTLAAPAPTAPTAPTAPADPAPRVPDVSNWGAATDPRAPTHAQVPTSAPPGGESVIPPASLPTRSTLPPPAAAAAAEPASGRLAGPRLDPAAAAPETLPAAVATPAATPTSPTGGRTALGVRTLPIDAGIQERFRLPEASGAYVIGVVGDLPASRAGVPPGSVIVALGDRPVRSPAELTRLVTSGPVGRPVSLEYVLPGGAPRRADVVLQTLEEPLESALVGGAEPTPAAVPSLQPWPAPTLAQRPRGPGADASPAALQAELLRLRARVEALERQLEAMPR